MCQVWRGKYAGTDVAVKISSGGAVDEETKRMWLRGTSLIAFSCPSAPSLPSLRKDTARSPLHRGSVCTRLLSPLELATHSSMSHPNVAIAMGACEHDGKLMLVMEFCP